MSSTLSPRGGLDIPIPSSDKSPIQIKISYTLTWHNLAFVHLQKEMFLHKFSIIQNLYSMKQQNQKIVN